MFITVERGPSRAVSVRLEHPDDIFGALEIRIAADVAAGESSFALFESGAAVQQFGADFFIAIDWLRRTARSLVADPATWERRLNDLVRDAPDTVNYVPLMDALRAAVVRAVPEPVSSPAHAVLPMRPAD